MNPPDDDAAPVDSTSVIYANVVSINLGPFDLIMDFGFQAPENRIEGDLGFERVARIAMSIGHAKSMLPLLAKVIAQYEQELGPVPAPGFEGHSKG